MSYERVAEWTGRGVVAIIEAGAGLAGDILIDELEFWDDVNGEWVDSPPTLPLDADIGIRVPIKNTGSARQHMRLKAKLEKPSGLSGGTFYVYHPLDPSEIRDFEFTEDVANWPSGDQEGDWLLLYLYLDADIY